MGNIEESVRRFIEAYERAVFARDVDGVMALYDPTARVFDAWSVWSYEGAQAWRGSVEGWLASLGDERVRVTAENLQVRGERPLAVASAVFRYAAISSAGLELRAMQNRLTWALRADGDAWKIMHEHTSVPVRQEDAKAIFERTSGL